MPTPRVPSAIKVLNGTDQPCRMNYDEPQPSGELPAPPDHLGPIATAEWERLRPELGVLGIAKRLDETALEGHCSVYEVAVMAQRDVITEGTTLMLWDEDENGRKFMTKAIKNPAVTAALGAWAEVRRFCAEFGMTPAARSKVRVDKPKDTKVEGKARHFG